jgi:hypothetical protein
MGGHPIIFGDERSKLEHVFTADDIHKKGSRLIQIRHGKAYMFRSSQTGDPGGRQSAGFR